MPELILLLILTFLFTSYVATPSVFLSLFITVGFCTVTNTPGTVNAASAPVAVRNIVVPSLSSPAAAAAAAAVAAAAAAADCFAANAGNAATTLPL